MTSLHPLFHLLSPGSSQSDYPSLPFHQDGNHPASLYINRKFVLDHQWEEHRGILGLSGKVDRNFWQVTQGRGDTYETPMTRETVHTDPDYANTHTHTDSHSSGFGTVLTAAVRPGSRCLSQPLLTVLQLPVYLSPTPSLWAPGGQRLFLLISGALTPTQHGPLIDTI